MERCYIISESDMDVIRRALVLAQSRTYYEMDRLVKTNNEIKHLDEQRLNFRLNCYREIAKEFEELEEKITEGVYLNESNS